MTPKIYPSALLILLVLLGCSRNAGDLKAKADEFLAQGKYQEAAIEYRNVLKKSPGDTQALGNLGICLFELGDYAQALDHLERARKADPGNVKVLLKLGTLHFIGGRAAEAREIATNALELDRKSLEAALLYASSSSTPEEIERAIRVLEQFRPEFAGSNARFHIAMADLLMRKGDPGGAEAALAAGTSAEPESPAAHLALGRFHLGQKDLARAEQELQQAAGKGAPDSTEKLTLAEFYRSTGRAEEARRVLVGMTEEAPRSPEARRRLARLALEEGKYDEAADAIDKLLVASPKDGMGLLLRGEVALRRGDAKAALADYGELVKLNPTFPAIAIGMARAHLLAGEIDEARARLRDLLSAEPGQRDALLLLAQVELRVGQNTAAIGLLEKLVETSPSPQVYALLAAAYAKVGNMDRTVAVATLLAEAEPDKPAAPYLLGMAYRRLGKAAQAREAFARSFALDPGAIEGLVQLADMDFADRQPDAALARVQKEIDANPGSGPLHFLLGDVLMRRGETEAAEAAYFKTLEITPGQTEAYLRLARLYAQSGKPEPALAKIGEAVAAEPGNASLHLMLGTLRQQRGDRAEAIESFERALELNPKLIPAANNLAYLYAYEKGKEARALELATLAHRTTPDDGSINDTYGWVLYRQGQYQAALEPLLVAAGKVADPEVQYHLGMTYFQLGRKDRARESLTMALAGKTPATAGWADEARQTLAGLQ